jgi:hypothetical protein
VLAGGEDGRVFILIAVAGRAMLVLYTVFTAGGFGIYHPDPRMLAGFGIGVCREGGHKAGEHKQRGKQRRKDLIGTFHLYDLLNDQ